MKKNILISLFLFAFSINAQKLTIDEFLRSADDDYKLKNHSELLSYYENSSMSTPFLDKIEFRAELEEFEDLDQQYSLRFYPKGWGETKSGNRVVKIKKKENKIEHEEYFNSALEERYELLLGYLETTALLQKHKDLLSVYKDRVTVLNNMAQTAEDFDVITIISAEDKLIDLQLDIVDLEDELTKITHKIQVATGKDVEIEFDEESIVDVSDIKELLPNSESYPKIENIYIRNRKLKIELAKSKYELEVAKTRDYISFFNLGYKTEDYKEPNDAFSIEIGFKLPFINPDRDDINKRKADHIEEKLKLEYALRDNSEKVISITRSMNRMFAQYDILAQRTENGNATTSFKKYMKMDGINPITLLKLKESMLKSDMKLIKIRTNVRLKYVQLINVLGKLTEKPIRNYLSSKKELLNVQK